jgi:hypothetical protein
MARKYKDWLTAYLKYSGHSEAPESFHFWTGISTLAGALRRQVWIDQGYFQWTPNFYIVFVAPPGIVSKSTTANIGMRLLKQLPDIHFGPDAVTWQALTQSLAGSTVEIPYKDGEYLPMSCITIVSSEFGTFLNPNDREMVDVLVSLWDGQLGTWEKATKTQGSDTIVNPWINLVACTTPSWIAGNFPEYMIGGGFTSRCVFVYGEKKRRLVAYPGKEIPTNFKQTEADLVHDLEIISNMVGEYQLSPEAEELGTAWYKEHYENPNPILNDPRLEGYKARKQTHVHKLAIILAASQRDELIISAQDLQRSIDITTQLENEMPQVFSLIGRSAEARFTEQVHTIIRRHQVIDKQVLVTELLKTLSLDEITKGLNALAACGAVQIKQVGQRVLVVDKGMGLIQTDFPPAVPVDDTASTS